uniref:DExD-box helicase 52 n=1 Tax=Ovis aries TaxID=9940 RepID=A0AC11EDY7_SHEEP
MDAHDLFRRLGAGAKFDLRRFSADAARFQIGKRKYDFDSSEVLQGLDFFGNKKSVPGDCGALRTHQELRDEEKKEEGQIERKKEQNRKKKKKMTSDSPGVNKALRGNGIQDTHDPQSSSCSQEIWT